MKYAKLSGGLPHFAPNPIRGGADWGGNPPETVFLLQGYKPVSFTERPEAPSGYEYAVVWSETESAIVQGWELREASELPDNEALSILLGGEGE